MKGFAMTLEKLISQSNDLADKILELGGELDPVTELMLEQNNEDIHVKFDQLGFVRDQLKMRLEYAISKLRDWQSIANNCEKAIDHIEHKIKAGLENLDKKELNALEYSFTLALNPSPKVVVDNTEKLPGEYLITKTETIVDKRAILKDLKSGKTVDGAHLEHGTHVRVSPSKRKQIEKKKAVELL